MLLANTATLMEIAAATGATLIGSPNVQISSLVYDTRNSIPPQTLFACIKGLSYDGHDFGESAASAGASALLVERQLNIKLPQLLVADTRQAMGKAAAVIYGNPSQAMRVIGVTGTKGKTTTTYLIKQLLEKTGKEVGLVGTTGLVIGDQVDTTPFSTTSTPEAPDLQMMLARMVRANCSAAVMEVTSHAAAQARIYGTEFDVSVFTNIAPDHLDYHGSFNDYLAAKTDFFRYANQAGIKKNKGAVINRDDPHWQAFAQATTLPVITVGVDNGADLQAVNIQVQRGGTRFQLVGRFGEADVFMPLPGLFNVYNALCAVGVLLHEGVPLAEIVPALEQLKVVPGRFERIDCGQNFEVYIDYAHTGPSMENVLRLARSFVQGQLIVVFGAGGDRPRQRRYEMGQAAGSLADKVIITSDNPRSEPPMFICAEIAQAVKQSGMPDDQYKVIVDRREAIDYAINMAAAGDTIIIAGKGHETYQEVQGKRSHFDDSEEARRALQERGVADGSVNC
jgi:UDP-N-acetylmuramoyl-L-alanyl-D-glutamate--2,6-diaminopimelate ligase